jgi:hypothetical protein
MHQGGGLQSVARALAPQLGVGDPAQFGIHQRDQAVEGLLFATSLFSEQ